jgi:hypothetical protein
MTSSQGIERQRPFLAVHSADEHRTIFPFPNTSYCTFYAFFSSFRITLWPMWLANSRRQPCFYPPVTRTRRYTELTKQLTNLMRNLCCAREHSVQFLCSFFYTDKLHSSRVYGALYSVRGPLQFMGLFTVYGALYSLWGPFTVYRALYSV